MQVNVQMYPVEILTGHYQVGGEMEIRGSPAVYVNDASFPTFSIHNATLTPLAAGTSVGAMSLPTLLLPKSEPQVILIGNFLPKDAQLLPHKMRLVCFTDTYVIKGDFHAGPETQAPDLFTSSTGLFFPATNAEIYPMRPLTADLGGNADLVYIHKDAVRTYYPASE